MKTYWALMGITLAVCSTGIAQEPGNERVVVPVRNSTHPRKVDVNLMGGSITVKSYNGKEVIVESTGSGSRSRREPEDKRADGMRRLDLPDRGISVEEQDNVVTVRMQNARRGSSVTIMTPADTSLTLHTMGGDIEVDGVKGEIDANSMNGKITLNNVSGSVLAHSMNGGMKVVMDSVDAGKPLSFTTMNGTIDVTLPADFKGNAKIRTDHGEVYSDFDFKLGGGAMTQKNDTSDGKFKVAMDRTITGTINGGGTEATFKTYNGTIYIRKRK
uniref:DUF4097 domain-containing protein n=1 Tax=Solibacter usitatus (strain Ellin6076) TaxID=234267 RepID=Q01Z56_SOLUE